MNILALHTADGDPYNFGYPCYLGRVTYSGCCARLICSGFWGCERRYTSSCSQYCWGKATSSTFGTILTLKNVSASVPWPYFLSKSIGTLPTLDIPWWVSFALRIGLVDIVGGVTAAIITIPWQMWLPSRLQMLCSRIWKVLLDLDSLLCLQYRHTNYWSGRIILI